MKQSDNILNSADDLTDLALECAEAIEAVIMPLIKDMDFVLLISTDIRSKPCHYVTGTTRKDTVSREQMIEALARLISGEQRDREICSEPDEGGLVA